MFQLRCLANKAKPFFPTSISNLSPNNLGDIIKNLSDQNLSGAGKLLESRFQSEEEGNTDTPNYYDLEEWYKKKYGQIDIENKEDKYILFLNAALKQTFALEKASNHDGKEISLVSGTTSAFCEEKQISELLQTLITSFFKSMPDGDKHELLTEHPNIHSNSETESLCSLEKGISAVSFKLQQIYGLKLVPNTQDGKGNIHTYSLISDAPDNPETLGKIAISERAFKEKLGASYYSRLSHLFPYAKSKLPPDTGTIRLLLENPSQLNTHELITLFHEVGHACESFLNRAQHKGKPAPDRIPWDLVETPSQLLEYFAADKDVAQIIDAPNAKHIQSQVRVSLERHNQQVGLNLIVTKAIFEVLNEKRSTPPEFQDFMNRAKKSLPDDIKETLNENSAEETTLKKALFSAILDAMGGGYKEKLYCYPLNRLLAAVIKKRITGDGTINMEGRRKLINWYNSNDNKKDSTQRFNFLQEGILEGWTPEEAIKALNIYSIKEATHPENKP